MPLIAALTRTRAHRTDALTESDLLHVEEQLRTLLSNFVSDEQSTLTENEKCAWTNAGTFLATLLLQRQDKPVQESGNG